MNMDSAVQAWLARDPDPQTQEELRGLLDSGQSAEVAERFAARLAFGTAGLRGVVGAGPGRMNALVVRETSAGLGSYLAGQVADAHQRGILVAYDGRLDSRRFARDAACVFAAQGYQVYLTPAPAATPVAAYTALAQDCAAAVVVTASHNPPQYNGYKVYWENGAQIIEPHDAGIARCIDEAACAVLPWVEYEVACKSGGLVVLAESLYQDYIDAIVNNPLFGPARSTSTVSLAYTALHGVGASVAVPLLAQAGFARVYSVASQHQPDGRFPTVAFPNPEEAGAMDAVLALARERGTTLACANDPDADRLAVAVRTPAGDYQLLTGDMLGVLLADYLLRQDHPYTPIVATTVVSSSLLGRLAAARGARYCETLTGFKWLSNASLAVEDARHRFLFAYEEALGYACGRQVLDKDGLSALLAVAQMAEGLAARGETLLDALEALYREYGVYVTGQRALLLEAGARPIGASLRHSPPTAIGGLAIEATVDLHSGERRYSDGRCEPVDLPSSDVLVYHLAGGARVIVRPSGTEPKLKCYYEWVEALGDEPVDAATGRAQQSLTALIDAHQSELANWQ